MGTLSAHVSEELEKLAKSAAKERSRGKMSAYIAELIENDVSGAVGSLPTASSADCLEALCKSFAPTYASDMAARCDGVDQPKALEAVLKLYAVGMLDLSDEFLRASYPLRVAEEGGSGYKAGKTPPV